MNDNRRPTLAATLWPQQAASRIARFAALAIGGALALAMSAKAQVPFYPVPMTLQTLVVLAIGAAFGARLAAATVLLYLAEGVLGLQVFAGASAGPAYMAGPTGGYLVGFLVAAALVGWLAERGWDRSLGWLLAASFHSCPPMSSRRCWPRRLSPRPGAASRRLAAGTPERRCGRDASQVDTTEARGFRAVRASLDTLVGQRPLRPHQQCRLLFVFRRGGERYSHRGRPARSRIERDHRPRRRE
jgi:hypothetical protein